MRKLLILLGFLASITVSAFGKDVMEYFFETHRLIAEEKYEEALERFVWFHENALDYQEEAAPSLYGFRLSMALSNWKELGELYPPAIDAMKKIRDEKIASLKRGEGDLQIYHDVVAINRTLGENEKTFSLFQTLAEDFLDETEREKYWLRIESLARDEGRFDLVKTHAGDLLERFHERRDVYLENKGKELEPEYRYLGDDWPETSFAIISRELALMAKEIGEDEKAKRIREEALSIVDHERLRELDLDKEAEAQPGEGGNSEHHGADERSQ